MTATAPARQRHAQRRAGAAFLGSAAVVHGGNYLFNVVMGRALGPGPFSDLLVILTLLLAVTLVSGTLQTAAAKLATQSAGEATHSWMQRRAFGAGMALAAASIASSGVLAQFFNAESQLPFVIFGAGLPALLAQAVDRGFLQGSVRFSRLALSYQAEMWSRLGGAALLVWAGVGLNGAVAALSLSFWISWVAARPRRSTGASVRPAVGAIAGAAALLAAGEVLVNHSDLLMVKRFSEPAVAGAFGAISVVGRVPFFAAWSLAALAFPHVAAGNPRARRRALAAVAVVGAASTAAGWAFPDMVGLLFGDGFAAYASYLGPYTATTALFSLARTEALMQLAVGRHRGTVLVLGAGIVQAVALWLLGAAIATVVTVRLVVTALLGLALVVGRGR
jgi:O-antigen/teichoic acid export membrane protein